MSGSMHSVAPSRGVRQAPGTTMLHRRRLLGTAVGSLLLALAPSNALAAPAARTAESVVQRLVEQVWQVLEEGKIDDRSYAQLLPVIEQQTDLSLLARLVLGRHWRQASTTQRDEYQTLFRSFVLQTFVKRVRRYAGPNLGTVDDRFEIITSRDVSKRDVLVNSRVLPPSSPPLRVDWRLRRRAEEPVIIDLIVEGVSLLVTQRSEFAAVVEHVGMDGLISELRSRVAQQI